MKPFVHLSRPKLLAVTFQLKLCIFTFSFLYGLEKCRWKTHHLYNEMLEGKRHYCEEPDFNNATENAARFRAFLSIRRELFWNLPPDTTWTRVSNAKFDSDNGEKIVCLYPKTEQQLQVYKNKSLDLSGIWLWTDDNDKCYVVEGNHRVSRWKLEGHKPVTIGNIFVLRSATRMPFPLIDKCLGATTKTKPLFVNSGTMNHWSVLYDNCWNPDASILEILRLLTINLKPYMISWKTWLVSKWCRK